MVSARWRRGAGQVTPEVISGATGALEKKGLNLYGCVVVGGAHRGDRLLPSASCRRPGRPGREVRAADQWLRAPAGALSGAGSQRTLFMQIRTSGPVRSQTQITQFGAAPCGHRANQVSGHKTLLHAYLAWVGLVADRPGQSWVVGRCAGHEWPGL